ncbi:hypothetical protein PtB15_4B830 [Puccinia triticina]|nr:hypothetical protein PtB15_4B830 [Puccinia triticina]
MMIKHFTENSIVTSPKDKMFSEYCALKEIIETLAALRDYDLSVQVAEAMAQVFQLAGPSFPFVFTEKMNSTQNVETSFPSGSDFAPTGFAGSEPIFNVHQRILAANHPANYYGHPARPAGPSHPGYNAVQPAGPSGYAPHPMAYHPSARPPPGPTAFTQPYPDGRPCADFPAPAGSFLAFSPSSSPATPRPFHPSSSTDPSQCNRPVQGTIGNSFHGSAPAQPLPSTLATSQNGSFDTSGQFRGPAQHDDQQIFSAICDTWLF